jgi:hypothetical protein
MITATLVTETVYTLSGARRRGDPLEDAPIPVLASWGERMCENFRIQDLLVLCWSSGSYRFVAMQLTRAQSMGSAMNQSGFPPGTINAGQR